MERSSCCSLISLLASPVSRLLSLSKISLALRLAICCSFLDSSLTFSPTRSLVFLTLVLILRSTFLPSAISSNRVFALDMAISANSLPLSFNIRFPCFLPLLKRLFLSVLLDSIRYYLFFLGIHYQINF